MLRYIPTMVLVLSLLTFKLYANTNNNDGVVGKRWAVLIAGSRGFINYRHQDYTGVDVNVQNFYAVLLGDKNALTRDSSSNKVVDSGPNDHIFIYYSDHGGYGILGMPEDEYVYAEDLINVLRTKHDAKGYQKMVIYVEACHAGSMFDGFLTGDLNIYVNTASNPYENSHATYCPGDAGAPWDYAVCLGDKFSVSWLEDGEISDWGTKTLQQQYQTVRTRTTKSTVMQYGPWGISNDTLESYFGVKNPPMNRIPPIPDVSTTSGTTNCEDTELLHYTYRLEHALEGSKAKAEALDAVNNEVSNRMREDSNMDLIVKQLFGSKSSLAELQTSVRPRGQRVVDDWDCFKSMVRIYREHCGSLSVYGRKYLRAMGNMCNANIKGEEMALAASQVCGK